MFKKLKAFFYRVYARLFTRRYRVYLVRAGESLPPPLSPEEERRCVLQAKDSEAARNWLIEHNLRLVVFIARKFENTGVMTEDLISIGAIGLIKAVNTFDPEKRIKLATYASRCIENEILMYLRRSCPGTKAGDGSLLRPYIVFFGEAVPNIGIAADEVQEADILIIIGTSLVVYPAAGLQHYARPSTPVYLIDPNPVSAGARVKQIQKGASEGMKELYEILMA